MPLPRERPSPNHASLSTMSLIARLAAVAALGGVTFGCASSGTSEPRNASEERERDRKREHELATQRFAQAAPESIAAADRKSYVRWLTDEISRGAWANRPLRIDAAVRFSLVSRTAAGVDEAGRSIDTFIVSYLLGETLSRRFPPAEAARIDPVVSRWIVQRFGQLEPAQQSQVATLVAEDATQQAPVFQVDAFAVAMAAVDLWRARGSTTERDDFVCPARWATTKEHSAERLPSLRADCRSGVVSLAMAKPELLPKLATSLLERRDPTLTQAIFVGLSGWSKTPVGKTAQVGLLRAMEREPSLFAAALLALGGSATPPELPVWDERVRIWNAREDVRGLLLYAMALAGFSARDFDAFGTTVASRGTSRDAQQILALPDGFRVLPTVWPMFERGAIGSRELVPAISAYWAPGAPLAGMRRYAPLDEIAALMCRDQRTDDMRAIQRFFVDLRTRAPEPRLGDWIDRFDPARCTKPIRPAPTKPAAPAPPKAPPPPKPSGFGGWR